jgi:alpha-L-fucosidase
MDELVDMLVDVVAKNGNLLLNIGPRADGSVIALMQERLRDMGDWLAVNDPPDTTYHVPPTVNCSCAEALRVPAMVTAEDEVML